MTVEYEWRSALAALAVVTLAAACGGESEAGEAEGSTELPADSVEPNGAPTATKAPSEPRLAVPAGTTVRLTLDGELTTGSNQVGDRFTATVSEPVVTGDRVAIPRGAKVGGRVTALRTASSDAPARIDVEFESIEVRGERHPLTASLIDAAVASDKEMKGEAKKIGGGAAAGALVGGLLGGNAKGALAGAAVGAAAGTGITMATRTTHAVLPSGSRLTIALDRNLRVWAGS